MKGVLRPNDQLEHVLLLDPLLRSPKTGENREQAGFQSTVTLPHRLTRDYLSMERLVEGDARTEAALADPSTACGHITCIVADDHPVVLAALCELLAESGIEVVGQATDGRAALEEVESKQPNVALLDLRMPGMSAIEVTRLARTSTPETSILIMTGYAHYGLVQAALRAGAQGMISKTASAYDYARAARLVASGESYVDPGLLEV